MRKTIRPDEKPKLLELLALAKQERDKLTAQLEHGDMNEAQFKSACNRLAQMVIVKAAVTSLGVGE